MGNRGETRSARRVTVPQYIAPAARIGKRAEAGTAFRFAGPLPDYAAAARANAVTQVINQNSSTLARSTQLIARQMRLRCRSLTVTPGGIESIRRAESETSDRETPR